ncbi:terminase [Rodentibacter ratti]|uniref:Terminase n=1 Tax=Rodentibacter ratti TaxID=1906745 RepID=A0A1V3L4H6_9PAST|nr:terminase small subunit [Rodentibacter ratti]OOF84438.1 terminase [Rodentibacter ratti]
MPKKKDEVKSTSKGRGLNEKQKRFVDEYLIDLNATQAAIRAGYSADTARQMGSENLSKPVIQEAIQEAQKNRSTRTQVTQDDVIRGLLTEAEWNGEGSSHSARVAAWAHLGKHLGMFTQKVEVSGDLHIEQHAELDLSGLNIDELEQLEKLLEKGNPEKNSERES